MHIKKEYYEFIQKYKISEQITRSKQCQLMSEESKARHIKRRTPKSKKEKLVESGALTKSPKTSLKSRKQK